MTLTRWSIRALLLAIGLAFTADTAQAQDPADEEEAAARPKLRVHPIPAEFVFDGRMNDLEWSSATDSIANLITIEPVEGGTPAGRTVVKVLADPNEIVVGARCYDNEPGRIVAFSKARDSELAEEDHLLIVIDTFMDDRSGYVFAVNPTGARFDGLVVERGEEVNGNWDTIWEAKTSRDSSGWSAEFRIPIKSLSFDKKLTTWSFNVQRRVQRLQETSRWAGANRDQEVFQTGEGGLLTDIKPFDLGMGTAIRPAVVGRAGQVLPRTQIHLNGDFSLDATQRLTSGILSAYTVNTDFAETEVDVRQTNVTRFPVFFPEKRTFFLEGSDLFDFGLRLDEESMIPFFSRRIGLFGLDEEEQSAVPINVGGKVNGRVDNTAMTALVVNTRKERLRLGEEDPIVVDVPNTTMGAMRVKQDFLEESSYGMMATFGDQLGRSRSWSAGLDLTLQTSEFQGEKNLLAGAWGLLNDRQDLRGDKSAWGVTLAYPNDLLDVSLSSIRIGNGFDPSLGYVPRNNVHLWDLTAEFVPRPPWPLVRQMFHELGVRLYNDLDNSRWQSYEASLKPIDWLFESGDRFEASVGREGDRPTGEFEVATDADVAPGSYQWTRFGVAARSAEKRRISAQVLYEFGDYYNGRLNTVEALLRVKPSAFLTLDLTTEFNKGNLLSPDDGSVELFARSFREVAYGMRLLLNFSENFQASSFTQYDNDSRVVGSYNRVRWTFDPLGDIFFVHNHNLENSRIDGWRFASGQSVFKLQYSWRF